MENLLLTEAYMNAYQKAFENELQRNFERVTELKNTTYLNDECGSFEFRINDLKFKVYLPTELINEIYALFVIDHKGNEIHLCNEANLSFIIGYIDLMINKYCANILENQNGQYYFINDFGIVEYLDEIDGELFFIDELNSKIYLK